MLAAMAAEAGAEVPSAIAIKDARVVPVNGAEMPRATVILRHGLIEDVGANAAVPADAWVIDGTGLTVYPGFVDALSTWGIPPPAPPVVGARGATSAPNPAAPDTDSTAAAETEGDPEVKGPEARPQTYSYERAADLVTPDDKRLESARAAGFTSSATFPNRGIVEGLGALIDLGGQRGRDMVVAQPIGQQILFRVGGGGFGRTFPASLMGNIAYVRQLYLDLAQYKEAQAIYRQHPNGNSRPEYDHTIEGLAESPRILLPAEETQQINRMIRFGQELKTPFVLYGMHEAYRSMDELKAAKVPVLVSLKWPEKPKNPDPTEPPDYRDLEMRERAPAVPGMLAKAGVKFAFYSDGVDAAPDLTKAVRRAIAAGLSREQAIRALTLDAAAVYGLEDRLGSVEKGKIANLVVTKGDAFADKTTVEYVLVDGRLFEPSKEMQRPSGPGSVGGREKGAKTPSDLTGEGSLR